METEIVPAVEVVTASDQEVPLPVNEPLVAAPVPFVMVMLEAVKPETDELKLKLRAVVVGLPVAETEYERASEQNQKRQRIQAA